MLLLLRNAAGRLRVGGGVYCCKHNSATPARATACAWHGMASHRRERTNERWWWWRVYYTQQQQRKLIHSFTDAFIHSFPYLMLSSAALHNRRPSSIVFFFFSFDCAKERKKKKMMLNAAAKKEEEIATIRRENLAAHRLLLLLLLLLSQQCQREVSESLFCVVFNNVSISIVRRCWCHHTYSESIGGSVEAYLFNSVKLIILVCRRRSSVVGAAAAMF